MSGANISPTITHDKITSVQFSPLQVSGKIVENISAANIFKYTVYIIMYLYIQCALWMLNTHHCGFFEGFSHNFLQGV